MATILQEAILSAFIWMKIFEFFDKIYLKYIFTV